MTVSITDKGRLNLDVRKDSRQKEIWNQSIRGKKALELAPGELAPWRLEFQGDPEFLAVLKLQMV